MSVMLYKEGGPHKFHGGNFDYIIVDELEVDKSLNDGWFKTTPEATKANKPKKAIKPPKNEEEIKEHLKNHPPIENTEINAAPSREELEAKAKELNIKFPANIKDKTLLSKINKALAE